MIDVVMLLWNAHAVAYQALKNLDFYMRRHCATPLRFILIDNASGEDPFPRIRQTFGDDHVYIRNAENVGIQAGWNQALRETRSDIVVLCNSDHLVFGDWFRPLELAIREFQVAWAAPAWLPEGPYRLQEEWDALPEPEQYAVNLDRFGSSCALIHWAVLKEAVGYFDERFFLCYGDTDYWERVKAAGLRSAVVTGVRTRHLGRQSGRVLGLQKHTEIEMHDALAFAEKWKDAPDVLARHPLPDARFLAEAKRQLWEKENPWQGDVKA